MPNKTIYVSEKDASLFDEAKELAGEALSAVISRALREFVARNQSKQHGMKEITVRVGKYDAEREQRFIGAFVSEWKGFSDDNEWCLEARIYKTQKGNWAVLLTTVSKGILFTNPSAWKMGGEYLTNPRRSELLVAETPQALEKKLPKTLFMTLLDAAKKYENPVEYLDI